MDVKSGTTISKVHTVIERRPPSKTGFFSSPLFDGFRRASTGYDAPALTNDGSGRVFGRTFNAKGAAANTANAPLVRRLKNRHLQMIAIGGSIGTGLFVGSGKALAVGGPASILLAYILIGIILYCVVQALGEMAVAFPVAGSFSAFATRFIDPGWGFAMGWNYAMQWLVVMPVEIMSASITIQFWNTDVPLAVWITLFLITIITINLGGIKVFGEAEFFFSILKVAAVIGFILLGIVINCAGGQDTGYIGGSYWQNPGAFNAGFKGFCNVLVTSSFAFGGTELVGLAAAETYNPTKSIPRAVKQVFWRISLFYIVSITLVGLLVPFTSPLLISSSSVDAKASPFVIAISTAGINGLDSVMNAVILIAVLSVANSSLFGSSRTLAALAEQGQAPKILAYIDRGGRPLIAILVAAVMGLLAFLAVSDVAGTAFTWLLALSGLSSIFTWGSICLAHIRFRQAWKLQGHSLDELAYRSPAGIVGSWIGLISLLLILVAQLWVAISPVGPPAATWQIAVENFFSAYLAFPIIFLFYIVYKFIFRTPWIRSADVDLKSGKNEFEAALQEGNVRKLRREWPVWKVVYNAMC